MDRRLFMASAACAVGTVGAGRDFAQSWPAKPVRILSGFPAGGQTDLFARAYAEYMRSRTGQSFVVENKAGASGSIAAVELKRSIPDGHTLMFTISTAMIMNRVMIRDIAYDAEKDFTLVSIMPSGSLPFVAASKTGAKTLREFIDVARTRKTTVGTYGLGSFAHLAVAELNRQFGLRIETVHYRGEGPMWTDLAGQFIEGAIGSYGGALSSLSAGTGVAVAVSRKRMSLLPDVPTFAEQGAAAPLFALTGFQCCCVPAGTPPDVVRTLSDLLVAAGRSPRVGATLTAFGIEESAMGYEETQSLYGKEMPLWLEAASRAKIEPV